MNQPTMTTVTFDPLVYKLVPVVPTDEMISAGFGAVWFGDKDTPEHEIERRGIAAYYKAMIAHAHAHAPAQQSQAPIRVSDEEIIDALQVQGMQTHGIYEGQSPILNKAIAQTIAAFRSLLAAPASQSTYSADTFKNEPEINISSRPSQGVDDKGHDTPLVVNHQAPGDLKIGDYVFASRWSDCDPGDPWAVGHVSEIGPNFVLVGDVNTRRWPKAMRITGEQGWRVIEQYPKMESDYSLINYKAIASVFGVMSDQGIPSPATLNGMGVES